MIPIILSGGSGTRLWPVSRTHWPKQFCQIFDQSLHAATIQRLSPLGTPWIITSQTLKDLTLRDAHRFGIPQSQILLEPQARNTAPAVALICHILALKNQAHLNVGIFPADHLVEDEKKFHAALMQAAQGAEQGQIVTLGITPTYPATGYGYIQIHRNSVRTPRANPQTSSENKASSSLSQSEIFPVEKFHEKPNADLASQFLKTGNFFWNAGIFIFKVDSMIAAFQKYQPEMWKSISQIKADLSNLSTTYASLQSISIDYAIMEKLERHQLSCVPCPAGWSDVGSWDAIQEIMGTDSESKIEISAADNFIHSHLEKKYAFIGVKDLIVVDTPDATLIAQKGSTQSVKEVVEALKSKDPQLAQTSSTEIRPWGQYEVLREEKHFKSKVIQVLPQAQLSYQSHKQREEHWLITQGTGEVVLDEKIIPISPGSYIKIPCGAKHRIRNTSTKELLEFVEVQLGTYFGEDDITRYQDDYQRT